MPLPENFISHKEVKDAGWADTDSTDKVLRSYGFDPEKYVMEPTPSWYGWLIKRR